MYAKTGATACRWWLSRNRLHAKDQIIIGRKKDAQLRKSDDRVNYIYFQKIVNSNLNDETRDDRAASMEKHLNLKGLELTPSNPRRKARIPLHRISYINIYIC